jgi:AraC-like DNA-binding protein
MSVFEFQAKSNMTKTNKQATPLVTALETLIVPWVSRWGLEQMYIALPSWDEYQRLKPELPEGSWITHKPLQGKRKAMYGTRAYGRTSVVNASWKEDGLHSARSPRLNFVISGNVAIQLADYVFHCRAGHYFLIPPGVPFPNGDKPHFQVQADGRAMCETFMMLPHYDGATCWTNREWLGEDGKLYRDQAIASLVHSTASPYLLRLTEEVTLPGKYQTEICNNLLGLVVTTLHRELLAAPSIHAGTMLPEHVANGEAPSKHPISLAQEYVQRHLRYPLTIEDVARQSYMSRTVFTAQFRQKTGKSFNEFVNDCRIEEAKRLLGETDLGIIHVASQVGLKPSRMRSLFHERIGMSPAQYRIQAKTKM